MTLEQALIACRRLPDDMRITLDCGGGTYELTLWRDDADIDYGYRGRERCAHVIDLIARIQCALDTAEFILMDEPNKI